MPSWRRRMLERALDALGVGSTLIEEGWTQRQVSVHSIYKVRASGPFDAYNPQWSAVLEVLADLDSQRPDQ